MSIFIKGISEIFLALSAMWQENKNGPLLNCSPYAKPVTVQVLDFSASRAVSNRSLLSASQPACLFWFHSLNGLNVGTKSMSKLE